MFELSFREIWNMKMGQPIKVYFSCSHRGEFYQNREPILDLTERITPCPCAFDFNFLCPYTTLKKYSKSLLHKSAI